MAHILLNPSRPESERHVAANILADYADDRADLLALLFVQAEPRQGAKLLATLRSHRDRVILILKEVLGQKPEARISEQEQSELAKKQANAAVALLQLGQEETVWPLFRHDPQSPALRTYLIHRLVPLGTDPQVLVRRLDDEPVATAQAALILALGEFPDDNFLPQERQKLIPKLLRMYREQGHPGLHSAVEWLLRHWEQDSELSKVHDNPRFKPFLPGRHWYVNRQGQTFAIIDQPVQFWMGSPPEDLDRTPDAETLHVERIQRAFAIGTKEVTIRNFKKFLKAYPQIEARLPPFGADGERPARGVTWFQAAQYCRWLSEEEAIDAGQMCYPSVEQIQKHFDRDEPIQLPLDYLRRTGYRLPTEAEWEFASRVGSRTTWFFGSSEEILPKFAWYLSNTKRDSRPVGLLKPNDFGLFDIYGNATEWTHTWGSRYSEGTEAQPHKDDGEDVELYQLQVGMLGEAMPGPLSVLPLLYMLPARDGRIHRGGAFVHPAAYLRSAARFSTPPDRRETFVGFRVARTHR